MRACWTERVFVVVVVVVVVAAVVALYSRKVSVSVIWAAWVCCHCAWAPMKWRPLRNIEIVDESVNCLHEVAEET